MLNHPKFKQIRHELQGNYHYFYQLCQSLYQRYCPRCVTQRRNVAHVKIDDCRLLALLCLQTTLGIQSQRRFWRLMTAIASATGPPTATLLQNHCVGVPSSSAIRRIG